jgi:hypothetical protein
MLFLIVTLLERGAAMLKRNKPLRAKKILKPKGKCKNRKPPKELQMAYQVVDVRDKGRCQHPECEAEGTEHHHIIFRSQGGPHAPANLILLCYFHHRESSESPHKSRKWRRYWEQWQEDHYPEFVKKLKELGKIGVIQTM